MKTEKFDLHIKINWISFNRTACVDYTDKNIYLNLKNLKKELTTIHKFGINKTFSEIIAGAISHEEIHRVLRQIISQEASHKFDNYVKKRLYNKKKLIRMIDEGMW